MADYYVALDGTVTKNKKKRKKADYQVSLDGTVTKNFQEDTTVKPSLTNSRSSDIAPVATTTSKNTLTQESARALAEQNILKQYGTYEQFLENNKQKANSTLTKGLSDAHNTLSKSTYEKLISDETNRLLSGSEFYGLTNTAYQEYLDNIQKNATDQKQHDWLKKQKNNLNALADENVKKAVADYVEGNKNFLEYMKKNDGEYALKQLGYSDEEIKSMADTYKREQNAERNTKMMEKADNATDSGIVGKIGAHLMSIGAGVVSAPSILGNAGAEVKEIITGEYAPVDTNAYAYMSGNYKERVRGNIEQDITKEEEYAEQEEKTPVWRKGLGMVYQGGASAVDSLLLSPVPGGMAIMGAEAAGRTSKDVFERTGSNTKALTTGVVAGGIETATEKMGLDNLWDIMKGSGKAATRSALANILAQSGIEGTEEMTSETLNTLADWIINKADSNLELNVQNYKDNGKAEKEAWSAAVIDALKQVGEAGLTGAIAGGIGGGIASSISTDTLTDNEQKVIDKEVERRIAEKEADETKVTLKEKKAIIEQVQKDLEKGYISIDTIESTLGGETYNSYKSIVDQESKLQEEIKKLEEMPNAQITVKQNERLQEARKQLEELQQNSNKTQLKDQLSKEVQELIKNDKLSESYNEKSRRSQTFETDVSKYDAKQQATIQKAIDSGILNNTNRTHEFVDMIAKISADKGVSFDFTDNKKLKESGFALEGKNVNGYIKDGNITLNVNSAKALNKVVGHEITHVLEGSDLYAELQEAVKAYATTKGEYKSKLEAITKLYEGVEGANVEQELTADLIGEYLFTDEAFVQQLSSQNRNIFQKIYDEIKYLCKVVSSGSKEAKQLEKVKRTFERAYEKNEKILYDINPIKKVGQSVKSDTSPTTYSISQNQQKTTENQKLSLGDDIAPTGKWNVKGSDIVLDDSTPIRKDIAPAQQTQSTEEENIPTMEETVKTESENTKFSRKEYHNSIIENFKEKFKEKGFDFDSVLNKAKNKSTFSSVDNTPQRFMEKTLGYKEGQILSDLTVNQTAQNESKAIRWLNSYTDRKKGFLAQISKQYGIKPKSKESAAAQMYGEGFYVNEAGDLVKYGDAELAKDFPDQEVQKNIKSLAKDPRIRQIYDDTLNRINESRKRNGYPEIPRRKDYFLHFRAMEDTFSRLGLPFNPNDIKAKDLPTDINGVTADLKPGQPYFASAQQRKGNRTTYDLLGGLERYLGSAKNQIYHIDDIQTLRALRNYIADTYGQAKGLESLNDMSEEEVAQRIEQVYDAHLSTFAKFLNEQANTLAGKTSLIDRGLEGVIGRKGITFLDTVNKQVGSNMVGMNISSSLTNLVSGVQAFAKANKYDFAKAFTQTVSNKIGSITGHPIDDFAEQNPLIVRRKGAEKFTRTPYEVTRDSGYILASAIDDFSTEIITRAKYNELTRKGMDLYEAHLEADKWASRILGDRSYGQQPQLYNSKMLGLVTKFQLEVRNQLDSMFYDTIQEAKYSNEEIQNGLEKNARIAAKVGSTFLQLAVGQHIFGQVFESIAGYNPTFDIIEVLMTMFGFDDEEDSEDTVMDNVEQGFLALLEDLPYTSIFTGGRIPIASALPIEEVLTGTDQYGNEKSRVQTIAEALPYYLLPTGYGQIKKSAQGLAMFDDDLPIAGSYTDSGNLRFPVEDTVGNRIQTAVFGQYANENARDYFDNERAPLKAKQIEEYKESGLSIQDYWDYREGLKGLNKLEEKADYIANLDFPISTKNTLINNISDRDEDIDLTDYSLYEDFEEFDFSSKNPGKYAVSKAVGGYKTYNKYTKALNGIIGNKDSNGNTVSGSRKQKVINYINGLEADYGEKLILFKNEYPADDTYNAEIVEYLNKRSDISYSDMETILKELGFTVDSDGTVRW